MYSYHCFELLLLFNIPYLWICKLLTFVETRAVSCKCLATVGPDWEVLFPENLSKTVFLYLLFQHIYKHFILMCFFVFLTKFYTLFGCLFVSLRTHNYQKWKVRLFTCLCHKIYRTEAVGLFLSNYTLKLRFLWVREIVGQFCENCYFVNYHLIKVRI